MLAKLAIDIYNYNEGKLEIFQGFFSQNTVQGRRKYAKNEDYLYDRPVMRQ